MVDVATEVEYGQVNAVFLDEIEDVEDTPCPTVAIVEGCILSNWWWMTAILIRGSRSLKEESLM